MTKSNKTAIKWQNKKNSRLAHEIVILRTYLLTFCILVTPKCGSSVVECLSRDKGVAVSSLICTGVTTGESFQDFEADFPQKVSLKILN